MLETVCKAAGRAADELNRRDVALALLAMPAADALAQLPTLRQELAAAGNPLSVAFWDSAESVLSRIEAGSATIGEIQVWLVATGTEPIQVIDAEMFAWPISEERGPVATEMHALLVAHLEGLVAAGTIDPDKLLSGDAAALAAYQQAQIDWLRSPLPDGRVPGDVVEDEDLGEFLSAWDEAEAEAARILGELLEDVGPRPCPEAELRTACSRLRGELAGDDATHQLLRAAGGVDPAALPGDDRELWLTLASGVVSQREQPPSDALDTESQAAWEMIAPAEWIATVVLLVRDGPGAPVNVDALARDAVAFELQAADEDDEPLEDDEEWLDDDAMALSTGLYTVVLMWRMLGAIDEDDRLTDLGFWGLPESLLRAWLPSDDKA